MGFWEKSLRICKYICVHGRQGVRRIAQQTGLSKSSVHRLTQAMQRRDVHPESWVWETEAGRRWLTRLVVATLYTFGLKRGVGMDPMSEFFARLRLDRQVGCSPSALRGVMQTMEAALLETAGRWEKDGVAAGEVREIIGAVDETCLEQMMLVFQAVSTGYIVQEEVADDRTYTTWKAGVEARLTALGTEVLSRVSARAKALMQLAEKGLECLSMPDFFHVVPEIITSYSLALGRGLRHAHQELKKAEEVLARLQESAPMAPGRSEAQAEVEVRQAEVTRWEEGQRTDRHQLETLSLTLHPFCMADSAPQTSAQVESHLQAAVEASAVLAQRHQLPARHDALKKVRTQLPALAALVDFWWQGVRQALEPFVLSPPWGQWVHTCLLPTIYWDYQVARTRCRRRKARIRQTLEAVRTAFERHPITLRLAPHVLAAWQGWAIDRVKSFQRTSSAVEGRHGYLAQLHHHQRGLPKHRYKVWTVLHNFDCRAPDGTTPAARFFRRAFPDLFETVLAYIEALPQPRRRKCQVALCH
jgi:hypothetical protein